MALDQASAKQGGVTQWHSLVRFSNVGARRSLVHRRRSFIVRCRGLARYRRLSRFGFAKWFSVSATQSTAGFRCGKAKLSQILSCSVSATYGQGVVMHVQVRARRCRMRLPWYFGKRIHQLIAESSRCGGLLFMAGQLTHFDIDGRQRATLLGVFVVECLGKIHAHRQVF